MGDRALGSVVLDVSKLPCDLATVDALARLQLTLRREGRELVLVGRSPELCELIELAGLTEVLGQVQA
jgi:anti-anti-sigma regulatory factor